MGERAAARGHTHTAASFRRRHDEAQDAALVIRRLLQHGAMDGAELPEQVGEQ
jgi:two-component system chemotaxis response regulator CheB